MAGRLSESVVHARDRDAALQRLPGPGAARADGGQTGGEGRHVPAGPEGTRSAS